jgi:hypothetical protein
MEVASAFHRKFHKGQDPRMSVVDWISLISAFVAVLFAGYFIRFEGLPSTSLLTSRTALLPAVTLDNRFSQYRRRNVNREHLLRLEA